MYLAAKFAGFRRRLLDGVVRVIAELVRAMNCYHSSLMDGDDTHPIDIERAMENDYSVEPRKPCVQFKRAQVTVQKGIDKVKLAGRAAPHSKTDYPTMPTPAICLCLSAI